MKSFNYKARFNDILNHRQGINFMLDYGGDQAAISIFAYKKVLESMGLNIKPRINSFVQLSALPEDEFLKKYDIGFRWLYPGSSKRTIELKEEYNNAFNFDIDDEIKKGYVQGGSDKYFIDEWGVKWQRSAYYFEMVKHPLQGKSFDEIKNYKFPDPDDVLRFKDLKNQLKDYYRENENYVISLSQSYGGILETALWIRGFMDFYMDLASKTKESEFLLDSITEYFIAFNRNYLAAVSGDVDILAIGDDYGMQDRTIMDPDLWRKTIKPRYKKLIESIKNKYSHIKIFHHSCGAIKPIINDLIEIGVDILNPIQPAAKDMDPAGLKKDFGNKITFHGGIDIQHLLMEKTPEEIKKEVFKIINILACDGGYIVAPSHNIQANTPVENIFAFYDAVLDFQQNLK